MGVFDPVVELGRGLAETLRSFLFEKTVTVQYPEAEASGQSAFSRPSCIEAL